jgi:hypothetical protein
LLFVLPDGEDQYEGIQRDPEFRVAQPGHYPVEKRVIKVVVYKMKQIPVEL